MTLTLFQVGVDVEHSQMLDTAPDFDISLLKRPTHQESVAGRAWPSTYKVFDLRSPRANFYYLDDAFLWMDERASEVCRPALERWAELIQLNLTGVGPLYLCNPLTTLEMNAIDWQQTQGKMGVYWNLTLHPQLVPRNAIFRLPKMSGLYVSSDLQNAEGDFFHRYQQHRLSGLYFKKLWDEQSGGVPKRSTARGVEC